MKTVYNKIREIRVSKKYSQQYMAIRLNIVVSAYSKIERGLTQLTIERLEQISKIFGVPADYITNCDAFENNASIQTSISPVSKNEQLTDMLALFKMQAESLIRENFDLIMLDFDQVKPKYEDIKENESIIEWYVTNGYTITSEEDYENAPALVTVNTKEQDYQGFVSLMNNSLIYYYFKFGLYPEDLSNEWKRYQEEHDDLYRYPLEITFDSLKMNADYNTILTPRKSLFKSQKFLAASQ